MARQPSAGRQHLMVLAGGGQAAYTEEDFDAAEDQFLADLVAVIDRHLPRLDIDRKVTKGALKSRGLIDRWLACPHEDKW